MSRIITYEKCDKCGKEYKDIYISFGHPVADFTWKWKCKCGHVNERLIAAMGIPKLIGEIATECKEGISVR